MLDLARVIKSIREITVLIVSDGVDRVSGFFSLLGFLVSILLLLKKVLVMLDLLVIQVLEEGFVRTFLQMLHICLQ